MFSRSGPPLQATALGLLGIAVCASAGGSADLDPDLISRAVVLYEFRGDGRDSSDKGQNKMKNLEFNVQPSWQMIDGKPRGLKLQADGGTVAKLPKALDGFDFGRGDFTIFIEMKLDADTHDGSWTVIATEKGENEPGGFSLKLSLDDGKFDWRFHLDNNEREASLGGNALSLRKPTKLSVVRENGAVTVFSVSDGETKEGTSVQMPNAPQKDGTLAFGSFPGTLFGAAIWQAALQRKELNVGWMD